VLIKLETDPDFINWVRVRETTPYYSTLKWIQYIALGDIQPLFQSGVIPRRPA